MRKYLRSCIDQKERETLNVMPIEVELMYYNYFRAITRSSTQVLVSSVQTVFPLYLWFRSCSAMSFTRKVPTRYSRLSARLYTRKYANVPISGYCTYMLHLHNAVIIFKCCRRSCVQQDKKKGLCISCVSTQ